MTDNQTSRGYTISWQTKLLESFIKVLGKQNKKQELLREGCNTIVKKWCENRSISARILFDGELFTNDTFISSETCATQNIYINKKVEGELTIFLHSPSDDGGITEHEHSTLRILTGLLAGYLSQKRLLKFQNEYGERVKELSGINRTSHIISTASSLDEVLEEICHFLPETYQFPPQTAVKISVGEKVFQSRRFKPTPWVQRQAFEYADGKQGQIEVYYLKEYAEAHEGPFLREERDLLINIANLISGCAGRFTINTLLHENQERNKELRAINQTRNLVEKGQALEDTLGNIVSILPGAWQYPQYTRARIVFNGEAYTSDDFRETRWCQQEHFVTFDNKKGAVEIFYMMDFPVAHEGPFLKEERDLLTNITALICGYINDAKGRIIANKKFTKSDSPGKNVEYRESLIKSNQPLQDFFVKQTLDKYIYLDMMRYKVKEILFVATLYDAFNLEKEDSIFERFMGPVYQYSMFSLPRITGVSSHEQALELLRTTQFDLVVLMVGADLHVPLELSERIKAHQPDLPVYLLLNQRSNMKLFEEMVSTYSTIDNLFVWNGDAQIFFAMVKSLEDRMNAETDTKIGLVRAILLVEDSPQYYSKYLSMFYAILFNQVNQLIEEIDMSELDKLAKIRSRTKILWAQNYEEAVFLFNKYKDFLTCIISDAEFERNGVLDKTAGIRFLDYAQSKYKILPMLLQSSEQKHALKAHAKGIKFVNKTSERLLNELKSFISHNSGYGDFVFRRPDGHKIGVAKNLREFETKIREIPADSLRLHAKDNQFSIWLMGRGQIEMATKLNPINIDDFQNVDDFRNAVINFFEEYRQIKKRGKILSFDETATLDEKNIVSMASGSFGGKGRGLAFINSIINNLDFSRFTSRINIRTPKTAIIGTTEFERFIEFNELSDKIFSEDIPFDKMKELFLRGKLSGELMKKLSLFLEQINRPIAVRSSSIYEDSLTQPFAGVFDTYIIPNNHPDLSKRLNDLTSAIKLVYASVYKSTVKAYYKSINHKIEEERMAVILQELVGDQFGDYYYPHLSGIAQSYNYYPVSHMKPEEGFAACAVGLGFYVVDGKRSFRFSPYYPKTNQYSLKDMLNSSQTEFYAVDLKRDSIDYFRDGEHAALTLLDISEAQRQGTLKHCVSTFNAANNSIEPGIGQGPLIVNFANILNFDYIPLAEIINTMLDTVKEAMGIPVEIEYAVNLNKDENGLASFYLLQIKPLTGSLISDQFSLDNINPDEQILFSASSLGNGKIEDIADVIYVDIDAFDKMQTLEMAREIDYLNKKMVAEKKRYILIGPGRWGTSDRFLGIPVAWSQISNAKIIVELSLNNFPLDASLGSHFFHNITSMNVGYMSVDTLSKKELIRWPAFHEQAVVTQTKFFKHVAFAKPLTVVMNGKKRNASICINK